MNAPAVELINPRAYQQTHALTELAVKKVDQFGVALTEACTRLEDLERENNRLWSYLKRMRMEHDTERTLNKQRLQHAQRATVMALAGAAVSVGMMVVVLILWGVK